MLKGTIGYIITLAISEVELILPFGPLSSQHPEIGILASNVIGDK